jgi:type I restriction enzyme, S subunit
MVSYGGFGLKDVHIMKTPIPEEWNILPFNKICDFDKKKFNPELNPEDFFNYLSISDIENYQIKSYKTIQNNDAPSRARKLVHTNDIIISTVRPYLRAFTQISEKFTEFVCSTGFSVLTPQIESSYVFYLVQTEQFVQELMRRMVGATYPAVTSSDIKYLKVPVPSLGEQQGIAEILRTIDKTIITQEHIIQKTELLKKGLMQELLTEGIGHSEFKETPMGEIPTTWDSLKLGKIVSKVKRGPSKSTNDQGKGYVYLTSGYLQNDTIDFSNKKYRDDELKNAKPYFIEKNEVIINCVNSLEKIGKAAVFDGFSTPVMIGFNNFALSIETNQVIPEYLKYYFVTKQFNNYIKRISKPAVQQVSFSSKDLLRISVYLPPVEEQMEIVNILNNIENIRDQNIIHKSNLIELKKGLIQVLLSGEVRVKFEDEKMTRISLS